MVSAGWGSLALAVRGCVGRQEPSCIELVVRAGLWGCWEVGSDKTRGMLWLTVV